MHLDSGSPVSIISAKTLRQLCPTNTLPLRPALFTLRNFQKNAIVLKGVGAFRVKFKTHTRNLDLLETERPYTLLGMSWFQPLGH